MPAINQKEGFLNELLSLEPLRDGADFFAGESASLLCLELLLNQRRGVEVATAGALAIHYHFGKPFAELNETISSATRWPYDGMDLRRTARSLWYRLRTYLNAHADPASCLISALPDDLVGAVASLERYYHRSNRFFDPLRKIELNPEHLRGMSAEQFHAITGLRISPTILRQRIASVVSILEIQKTGEVPERRTLLTLDRVGDETADTLLVYLFKTPALIVDEYLRRILYRHFVLEMPSASRRAIERIIGAKIDSIEAVHRLHARVNELGQLYCFRESPHCYVCPLNDLPHRS